MRDNKEIAQVAAAIDQIASSIDRLKSLGVIRSQKFYEDLAEWLVAQLFKGTLAASKIQQHWDVQCDGDCVQVRSHWKAADNPNRWSNSAGTYDVLVVVVFDQSLRVAELYRVPSSEVLKLRRPNDRICWDDLQDWRVHAGDAVIPLILKPLFAQADTGRVCP